MRIQTQPHTNLVLRLVYFDAHNHLHDSRLLPWRDEFLAGLPRLGLKHAIVNGTRQSDWDAVAELTARHRWLSPAFGLHPWFTPARTASWFDELVSALDAHPAASIGEIGLDRWIDDYDIEDQIHCFTRQLRLAADRNLPVTIHCLQAWGCLWNVLREHPVPKRGFLLHAYGGPAEMVQGFVELGARFSFSPSFVADRKIRQRTVFTSVPPDRLLVETDAPDLPPPPAANPRPIAAADAKPLNHPENIDVAYAALAELRGWTPSRLGDCIEENFELLFNQAS